MAQKVENPNCVPASAPVYQHVTIRGSMVSETTNYGFKYVVEVDNDRQTQKMFKTYDAALLYCIYILSNARTEDR